MSTKRNPRPVSASCVYLLTKETLSTFDSKQRRASTSDSLIATKTSPTMPDSPRKCTACIKPHHHHQSPTERAQAHSSHLELSTIASLRRGSIDTDEEGSKAGSRSSSSSRVSRREPKSPIPTDERPRWVGAWSSISAVKPDYTTTTKSVQRRQSFHTSSPTLDLKAGGRHPGKVDNQSSASPLSPSFRARSSAVKDSANQHPTRTTPRGRSDSISGTLGKPSRIIGVNSSGTSKDILQDRTADSGHQERKGLKGVQGGENDADSTVFAVVDKAQSGAAERDSQGIAILSSCPPPSPTESSPALIRRFLINNNNNSNNSTVSGSVETSFTIDAAQSVPRNLFTTSIPAVSPFTATASMEHRSSSSSSSRGTSIFTDDGTSAAVATAATSTASETDPETPHPSLPSSAQEAFSMIMKQSSRQGDLGTLVNALTSKTRSYISRSRNNSSSSNNSNNSNNSNSSEMGSKIESVTGKSRSSLISEGHHHMRISSIESFPKHPSSSSSKMQYIRDLLRLSYSPLGGLAPVADGAISH